MVGWQSLQALRNSVVGEGRWGGEQQQDWAGRHCRRNVTHSR